MVPGAGRRGAAGARRGTADRGRGRVLCARAGRRSRGLREPRRGGASRRRVRRVVARETVVYLEERGSPHLAAARPLLESVVGSLIETGPFQRVVRAGALEANRVFFVRDREKVLFDLGGRGSPGSSARWSCRFARGATTITDARVRRDRRAIVATEDVRSALGPTRSARRSRRSAQRAPVVCANHLGSWGALPKV
jgi:hypothetical protein